MSRSELTFQLKYPVETMWKQVKTQVVSLLSLVSENETRETRNKVSKPLFDAFGQVVNYR